MKSKQEYLSSPQLNYYERIINLPETLNTILLVLFGGSIATLVILILHKQNQKQLSPLPH